MLNTAVIIGMVLTIVCTLSATLNFSLHDMPWGRLSKALAVRKRSAWLETYRDLQEEFVRATAIIRMITNLGLILAVLHLFGQDRSHDLRYYTEAFLVCAAVTLMCVVAIPQPCAKYVGVSLLANVLPVLQVARLMTCPVIAAMGLFDGLVRRLAGVPKLDEQTESEQIEQDVLDAVDEAKMHGAVDDTEKAMIKSVMALDESAVGEIMTPRTEVVGTPKTATLEELKALIKQEGHSRIPVYDQNIDQILGMVYAKDLLHVSQNGPFDIMAHIREVPFVPESKLLSELLQEFRMGKTHAAIVLDEYGGTAGLVTIEDILEELVGEITDEYEQPEPEPINRLGPDAIEVDARVHVDEINELLSLTIPEGEDYETIGGFVFAKMGKIPCSGEQLVHQNARLTILAAEDRRINRLRIELIPPDTEQ